MIVCVEQSFIIIIVKVNVRESELSQTGSAQTFNLTRAKPLWYVTITKITLGCPFNPVNDFGYGRKYLRKLVQVRNAIQLTQRLLIKTPIRF